MIPPERSFRLSTVVAIVLGVVSPLAAQNSNITQSASSSDATAAATGWILTPSIGVSSGWDSNVFVQGAGDEPTSDLVNTINPRLTTTFNGRRSLLSVNYSGAFLLYRNLSDLNSYDQRASVSGRRRLTKQLTFYIDNSFASSPTTEISGLVAVPFVRTGSTLVGLRTGIEAALSKQTTLSVGGGFQWVSFDTNPAYVSQLHGGHGWGGEASFRHRLSARTSLIADYKMEHATVYQSLESFDVWSSGGGVEQQFSEHFTAFGELGISHLLATVLNESKTGPAIRAGLTYKAPRASVIVSYSRMVLARPLLQAWVGRSFDSRELDAAVLVLQVLSLTVIVRVGSATSSTLLKGAGHHRLLAVTNVSTALVNLVLSIALIGRFQLTGVAIGTLLPVSLGALLILVPAGCARVGVTVRRAWVEAVWPAVWPCAPMIVWALAMRTRPDLSLVGVGIAAASSAGVYALFFLRFSTTPSERALLAAKLREVWLRGARRLQPSGDRRLQPGVNSIPTQGTTPHV